MKVRLKKKDTFCQSTYINRFHRIANNLMSNYPLPVVENIIKVKTFLSVIIYQSYCE